MDFWKLRPFEVHWLMRAKAPEADPSSPENWREVAFRNLKAAKAKHAAEQKAREMQEA